MIVHLLSRYLIKIRVSNLIWWERIIFYFWFVVIRGFIIGIINKWVVGWAEGNPLIKVIDARFNTVMIRKIIFMVNIGMMIFITMMVTFEIVITICMVVIISKMIAFKNQIAFSMMITVRLWLFSSRLVTWSMIWGVKRRWAMRTG